MTRTKGALLWILWLGHARKANFIEQQATLLLRDLRVFLRNQHPVNRNGRLAIDNVIETSPRWPKAMNHTY